MPQATQEVTPDKPLDQEIERRAYAANMLRSKRERIARLPVERQLAVYGVAFDRFVKPTLSKSKLSEKELELAKDRWITGIVAPHMQQQLGKDFGNRGTESAPFSAAFAGTLAGVAGATGSFIDWLNRGRDRELRVKDNAKSVATGPSWFREQLRMAEKENYDLALAGGEKGAHVGAGIGKAIPSVIAFEVGAGAIPGIARTAPLAWRALGYLTRTGVGTAASTVPFSKTSGKQVVEQTAVNVLFDALLHGAGKAGAKGFQTLVSKASSSGKPNVSKAASLVDELFGTIAKEKFPNKPIDQLNPQEFDSIFQEASARRQAAQVQAKEAQKGVREAQKATKPTPEAQALAKAQGAEQRLAERKAASEKAKFVSKQLAEYKKRTGALPAEQSEHFKRISAGETTGNIFGKQETQAVQAATQVATVHQAQTLAEGAPTAVDAVRTVQSVAMPDRRVGERKGIEYRVPQIGTPGKAGIKPQETEGEKLSKEIRTARAGTPSSITEGEAIQHLMKDPTKYEAYKNADSKTQGKMLVDAKQELVGSGSVAAKAVSKSKFNIDISKIQSATTPEEFANAKKDAIAEINKQAIEQARSAATTKEKMAIASEANKEIHRVRSAEVPGTISKKSLDSKRKSSALAEGQAEFARKVEVAGADPEGDLIEQIDKSKEHEKWFKVNNQAVYLKVVKEWTKSGSGEISLLNTMLDEARSALEKK